MYCLLYYECRKPITWGLHWKYSSVDMRGGVKEGDVGIGLTGKPCIIRDNVCLVDATQ